MRRLLGLWIVALVIVVAMGGCTAAREPEQEQKQNSHAISQGQFDAIQIGTSQADVIAQLGTEPADTTEFIEEGVIRHTCIYYYNKQNPKQGRGIGEVYPYQFCFTPDGLLSSKNSY